MLLDFRKAKKHSPNVCSCCKALYPYINQINQSKLSIDLILFSCKLYYYMATSLIIPNTEIVQSDRFMSGRHIFRGRLLLQAN